MTKRGPGWLEWLTGAILLGLAIGTRNRFAWLLLLLYAFGTWLATVRDRRGTQPGGRARGQGHSASTGTGGHASGGGAGARGASATGGNMRRRPPHEVLGVAPGADARTVREAYLTLVKQYHPDRVASLAPEFRAIAEARMREINEAFEAMGGRGRGAA